MENKVLEFINRRFPVDCNWLTGNCFFFAKILNARFSGEIYYDTVNGHFVFYRFSSEPDECGFYDYSGKITPNEDDLVLWDEYDNEDPLHFNRILEDCIW